MISFVFAASIGTLPGAYLARFFPAQNLQQYFGYFLLSVAAFVLYRFGLSELQMMAIGMRLIVSIRNDMYTH